MPYVNIKVTREGTAPGASATTPEQKRALIEGVSELLLQVMGKPLSSTFVVIDEVELMERLLEDLRVLTLAEAGRLQLHREPTDLEAVAGDVIASFSAPLEARHIEHTISVEGDVGEIEADPYRLRQVLSNLISNSINQMPEG